MPPVSWSELIPNDLASLGDQRMVGDHTIKPCLANHVSTRLQDEDPQTYLLTAGLDLKYDEGPSGSSTTVRLWALPKATSRRLAR